MKLKPEYYVVIAVVVLAGLWYLGVFDEVTDDLTFLPNEVVPTDSENLGLNDADLYYMLVTATGKPLNRETTYEYIDTLNMRVYGSNEHYTTIAAEFRTEYASWTNVMDTPITSGQALAWTQGDAVSVITATNPIFRTMYGYETLTLTAHGDIADYNDFYWFVVTS